MTLRRAAIVAPVRTPVAKGKPTGAYAGIQSIDPTVPAAAKAVGMSPGQILAQVELPLASPIIVGGLRAATLQVVATATLAAYTADVGLGRYLYDLDKVWEDLDQYNRPVREPNLPEWAIPAHVRRQPQAQTRHQSAALTQPRQGLVQQETLAHVKQLCECVGFGLSKFALQKYGGATDASKIGFAKLTTVLEKLTDLAKGVERLRAASAKLGDGRYSTICRELNLASDSLDDVPDRDALSALLKRVESETGGAKPAPVTTASTGKIEELRGQLLQAARKVAESGRPGWPSKFGDVIAQATEGRVTLEGLKTLCAVDVPILESALVKLGAS